MSPTPIRSEKGAFVRSPKDARETQAQVGVVGDVLLERIPWNQLGPYSAEPCAGGALFTSHNGGIGNNINQFVTQEPWLMNGPNNPRGDVVGYTAILDDNTVRTLLPQEGCQPGIDCLVDCLKDLGDAEQYWANIRTIRITDTVYQVQNFHIGTDSDQITSIYNTFRAPDLDAQSWFSFGALPNTVPVLTPIGDQAASAGNDWLSPDLAWTGRAALPVVTTGPAGLYGKIFVANRRAVLYWPTPTVGAHPITWQVENAAGVSNSESFTLTVT